VKVFAKGGEFELDPALVRSLVATYPAVNVRRELERMYLWTLKNPSKRWDLPLRGIEGWLKRETKRALEKKATAKQAQKANEVAYKQGVRPQVVGGWWSSDEATMQYGRQKGIHPRPGESMASYRARLKVSA
jgi:hypothetical protein